MFIIWGFRVVNRGAIVPHILDLESLDRVSVQSQLYHLGAIKMSQVTYPL